MAKPIEWVHSNNLGVLLKNKFNKEITSVEILFSIFKSIYKLVKIDGELAPRKGSARRAHARGFLNELSAWLLS